MEMIPQIERDLGRDRARGVVGLHPAPPRLAASGSRPPGSRTGGDQAQPGVLWPFRRRGAHRAPDLRAGPDTRPFPLEDCRGTGTGAAGHPGGRIGRVRSPTRHQFAAGAPQPVRTTPAADAAGWGGRHPNGRGSGRCPPADRLLPHAHRGNGHSGRHTRRGPVILVTSTWPTTPGWNPARATSIGRRVFRPCATSGLRAGWPTSAGWREAFRWLHCKPRSRSCGMFWPVLTTDRRNCRGRTRLQGTP